MGYTLIAGFPRNSAGAVWWHISVGSQYFIVSAVAIPGSGPETFVFPADDEGNVIDWGEIVAVRGTLDHQVAITELLEILGESDEEEEASNLISESEAHDKYDDMLDEIYPVVECGDLTWYMSRVLKEMDPTAYRTGFNDWLDSEGLELE